MNIGKINTVKTQKTDNSITPKQTWFNRGIKPDKFEKSEEVSDKNKQTLSYEEEIEILSKLKTNDSKSKLRFPPSEIKKYEVERIKSGLTFDMVMKLADTTNFDMETMGRVAKRIHKTGDTELTLIKNINKCAKKMPNGIKADDFQTNKFEPQKELQLINTNKRTEYYFDTSCEEAKIIGKTKMSIFNRKDTNNNTSQTNYYVKTITKDYRNDTVSEKINLLNLEKNTIENLDSETITRYSKDGTLLRTEKLEKSDIEGIYNIKYEYPNGKVEDIVNVSIDKNTGIKTVKKDMKSSDGTKTEFLYEDDPTGNRLIDYKITSPDGKVLMKNSQTFEVVNDNHFISSKNGHKYDIKTTDKSLTIKDINHSGKEASISFNKLIEGNKNEIINLLKKVPGEELFEVIDCCKKIQGNNPDKILQSGFHIQSKKILMADNLFVFLHELGHAKDAEPYTLKNVIKNNKLSVYEKDSTIQQEYLKERKAFNQNFSDDQREHIKYFIQKDGHYNGEWGGLQELIAETNALTNSIPNKDIEKLGSRIQYAQQHFPRTIAAIQNAMYYKNDIEAINYYGT